MPAPEISVILPVYNGTKHLHRSIESVLKQAHKRFELVICDDASSDDSIAIIASFSDSRIRLLRNETNQGLFPTLNRLIRASRAPLIRLWSQDDRMKPHCLAVERAFWNQYPDLGMSYCLRDHIDVNGKTIRTMGSRTSQILSPDQVAQLSFYHGSLPGNISTVMLRREVLDRVGLFREDMHYAGDYELWTRISSGYNTGVIAPALIDLRFHTGQLSRQPRVIDAKIREDHEVAHTLLERFPDHLRPHALHFERWHRHVSGVHQLVKALVLGRWAIAGDLYRTLRSFTSIPASLLRWLVSGNGRWFMPKPRFDL
jgi:hypothetical protein